MPGEYSFICACERHGTEIHDGTKNECCPSGILMPMVDDPVILGVKGQAPFVDAALRLAAAVTGRKIILKGLAESWYVRAVTPFVDAIKAQQIETTQPVDEANRPEGLDATEEVAEETSFEEEINRAYLAGFAKGYENGFGSGFERGIDTGFKLSPSKK